MPEVKLEIPNDLYQQIDRYRRRITVSEIFGRVLDIYFAHQEIQRLSEENHHLKILLLGFQLGATGEYWDLGPDNFPSEGPQPAN